MASKLYNYFLTGWINHTQTETSLTNAVAKGYLTEEEKATILATPQNP